LGEVRAWAVGAPEGAARWPTTPAERATTATFGTVADEESADEREIEAVVLAMAGLHSLSW